MNECFVTGCDVHTEWMLKWFITNYRQHNDTPIVFCDFGVSKSMLTWINEVFDAVIPYTEFRNDLESMREYRRWFLKPSAMLRVKSHKAVWLDTDCEVLGDISDIFDLLVEDRINIVQDLPWSSRRREIWHNTGVFGIINKPDALYKWVIECRRTMTPFTMNSVPIGDQDALHALCTQNPIVRMSYIHDLPNVYNWLRIQLLDGQDDPNKLIMHWTGPKGKDIIKEKIKATPWQNSFI